jgi:hypothetical protein
MKTENINKIKIGGVVYALEFIEIKGDTPDDVSEIDLSTNTISIDKDLPLNQKHLAILHEAIHGINWKFKEPVVEFLAQDFYQFMRDNKELIQEIIR